MPDTKAPVPSAGVQKIIDRINASNLPPDAKAAIIAFVKAMFHVQ